MARPFWTVTGCLSLVVNGVLIAILLSVLPLLGSLQFNPLDIGSNILGGLYSNFEKMDRATIKTTIPVESKCASKYFCAGPNNHTDNTWQRQL